MRYLCLCWIMVCSHAFAQTVVGPKGEVFTRRVVAARLSDPWEIIYGPDGYLWVTEAKGYKVSRIDPATGNRQVLLDVNAERNFPRYDQLPRQAKNKPWPQGGLMGMALHPQLLTGKPYVYLAYHYHFAGVADTADGCKGDFGGCFFTARIVRYWYNQAAHQLEQPELICNDIPASNDHNGGRLLIAPINGKDYLFYTVGDMGAGQFNNAGRPNHAQQPDVYEGKILRFNTEPDGDASVNDRWIPDDNPFSKKQQNAVYSYGHRNPQGLAYAVINNIGRIYESEHGPYSDDEINIIRAGHNYGHPLVIGYADGNYNGLAAAVTAHQALPGKWHTAYPFIKSEQENASIIGEMYTEPIETLYPNNSQFLQKLYPQILADTGKPEWPSEAPASLDIYMADAISGWRHSLLLPSLKNGHLIRLQLNAAGDGLVGDTMTYFKLPVRYRDIAISPDGKSIYLSTDSAAVTSGPSKEDPKQVSYRGSIIEYRFQGIQSMDRKAVPKSAARKDVH